MSAPGFPGVWGSGFWDNNVWETVPDQPPPTDDSTYGDTNATHSIEFAVTVRLDQEIAWSSPPAQITPLRNYRSVMGDYRVTTGIPVSPPTLDAAVPILVSVDPKGVAVPKDSRDLPSDIDTLATLRWIAQDQYVNADDVIMQWWDTTGTLSWDSYDSWMPVLDDTYDYQITRPNNAEIVQRSCMMFNAAYGMCMNTSLSINPVNNLDDIEFLMVLWTHPLIGDQEFSALLDNGQAMQGFHDMPYVPGDSLTGVHQALHRYPDKIVHWEDADGMPLHWTQVSAAGRPVLYRVRYGKHPLIEVWGPTNSHMSYATPTHPGDGPPLCSDYVLGRIFNRLDETCNGGMHLFEINYYDHELSTTDAAAAVAALKSCYAISD